MPIFWKSYCSNNIVQNNSSIWQIFLYFIKILKLWSIALLITELDQVSALTSYKENKTGYALWHPFEINNDHTDMLLNYGIIDIKSCHPSYYFFLRIKITS